MKFINYYFREDKHPVTSVTVFKHEDKIARGIAICNKNDQFIKKVGRELSKDRAIKAFKKEKSFGKISQTTLLVDKKHKFKCEYKPELTEYEIELLKDPKTV